MSPDACCTNPARTPSVPDLLSEAAERRTAARAGRALSRSLAGEPAFARDPLSHADRTAATRAVLGRRLFRRLPLRRLTRIADAGQARQSAWPPAEKPKH